MSGAEGVLAVNIGTALLFAVGYAIIAFSNASQRRALWFGVSYLIGMVSPVSDLLGPVVGASGPLEAASYASFLLATLSISLTFSLFHRRRPPWIAASVVLVAGLGLRAAIWGPPRESLDYGMAYQAPFMLAAVLAMRTVLAASRRRPLHLALAAVFGLSALTFMLKPFAAAALGPGAQLADYTRTTYALVSQLSTGLLLLAAGILLLLIVAQKAVLESQRASEIDPLSGLANRRGFSRLAELAIARGVQGGLPVAAVVFDLDHFKRVNDTFGHAAGDVAIAAFAQRMREIAPPHAVLGRLGGEEFAMVIEGATLQRAWLAAEAIRLSAAHAPPGELPPVTVSGGVAAQRADEDLYALLARADRAAYAAKAQGRNRICLASDEGHATERRRVIGAVA
jgi:diguanylate cyclase (GGDEF)-like protein